MTCLSVRLRTWLERMLFSLRHASRFRLLGRGAFLYLPYRVDGDQGISLGDASVLQRGGWLYCAGRDGGDATLEIGRGCIFGYNNHIAAVERVRIGNHVLTANNVYISDNQHAYADIATPIMHQPVVPIGPVDIGDGCWLGENVAVIGARIGRNCVIGANAVVTRDIPDYSVAVGAPAKVIKRYDQSAGAWIKVDVAA